jgi:hypothetical protein
MSLLMPKQIRKHVAGSLYVAGYTFPAAAVENVSLALIAAATTAGYANTPVPIDTAFVSATAPVQGFIVDGNNRVSIYSSDDKTKLSDDLGNEIYGRLTFVPAQFQLRLLSLVNGVETPYIPDAPIVIDFAPQYLYSFESLPHDFATGIDARFVGDDPTTQAVRTWKERLTVVTMNNLSLLTNPYTVGPVDLNVNGHVISSLSLYFTVAGTTVTWLPALAGYNLVPTDIVTIEYPY